MKKSLVVASVVFMSLNVFAGSSVLSAMCASVSLVEGPGCEGLLDDKREVMSQLSQQLDKNTTVLGRQMIKLCRELLKSSSVEQLDVMTDSEALSKCTEISEK